VMPIFKHRIDLIPSLHALAVTVLQLTLYFSVETPPVVLMAGLLIAPLCFLTVSITHNHFHVAIFNKLSLNRTIEMILFFQNGFTEGSWKPTHNLHHAYYLNRPGVRELQDPNNWRDVSTGYKRHLCRYIFPFILSHWKRHASMSKARLRHGSSWNTRLVRISIVLLLIWLHPLGAICLFFLPMALSQFLTAIHSYYQHAGLDTDNPYHASFNYHGPFYLYNIGYHTAHHLKPGLHWSKLAIEHQKISSEIPAQNMVGCYLSWTKYSNPRS